MSFHELYLRNREPSDQTANDNSRIRRLGTPGVDWGGEYIPFTGVNDTPEDQTAEAQALRLEKERRERADQEEAKRAAQRAEGTTYVIDDI